MDMPIFQIFFVLITMSYLVDSQTKKDDVLFKKIGTHRQGNVEKTYWVPRYMKAQWYLTRPICKAHGFDILTISTLDEFRSIASSCQEHKDMFGRYVHIGAVAATPRSKSDWYWVTTNEMISDDLPWQNGQPDCNRNNEHCLTMTRDDGFNLNDIPCHGSWEEQFIYESVNLAKLSLSKDEKIGEKSKHSKYS